MEHRAATDAVNRDAIHQIRSSKAGANSSREKTERVWFNNGESDPSNVDSNAASRARWHECYGQFWELKIAFEKEHNRRVG